MIVERKKVFKHLQRRSNKDYEIKEINKLNKLNYRVSKIEKYSLDATNCKNNLLLGLQCTDTRPNHNHSPI